MPGQILEPGQIEAAANIPPFLRLPPAQLFAQRGQRLRQLAEGHPLGDYLSLLAELCDIQQNLLDAPPTLPMPDEAALRRSVEHGMPPLGFEVLVREGAWLALLEPLLEAFATTPASPIANALQQLRKADAGQRKAWALALLNGQFDLLPAALVPFLGATLQVAFSHWLLRLPEGLLSEREEQTLCPACGSPPVAGVIHNRGKYNGLRYLACSLCSCQWHYVRIKCSHCRQSKGLFYLSEQHDSREVIRAPLRAEVCPNCQSYLKQCYLEHDEAAEPQADDLASLALDVRLAEEGYLRSAPNLLLSPGGSD